MIPELALMVRGGLTPMDVLRAATSVAAVALGLEQETGRVAAGLAADLLAVAGDPLADISVLADVRLVMANGRIVVNRLAER
jgi:imidazolonepropionase-like amidohydrolase